LGHILGGVCANPLENVHEVIVGIDALEPAGAEEALDDAQVLGSELCPTKEPVFPAQGDRTNLPFNPIGIYGHVGIFQEDLKRTLAAVLNRPGF